MANAVFRGKQGAGKPQLWLDEGNAGLARMRRGFSLCMSLAATVAFAAVGLAEPQVVEYDRGGIDYVATIFTESGEFTVPDSVSEIDYLVVGGGGGGGGTVQYGGGGGAGGLAEGKLTVSAGEILLIAVGAGGTGATSSSAAANGEESSVKRGETVLVSMAGGGAGGCNDVGFDGACGGGGAKSKAGGKGTVGHSGYAGSSGGGGAGGGGMGSGGDSEGTAPTVGTPGVGVVSAITGEDVTYAAGGAGGSTKGPAPAVGAAGTGNGGGGAKKGQTDGLNGGSGIVVIRYAKIEAGQRINSWISEPSLGETVFVVGEGTTMNWGITKSGGAVTADYTEEQLKALPAGAYTLTFTVEETDEWTGLEKAIKFYVRTMKFPVPGEPDAVATTYTWNGGEGYWCDLGNWTADRAECYGYPNSTEFASAVVASEATIKADPDGTVFGPAQVKDLTLGAATTFTGGELEVAGKLTATADVRLVDATLSAAAKVNLLFTGNVVASNSTLAGSSAYLYAYGDGKTFVEEGEFCANTMYQVRIGYYDKTRSTGCRYVVKNGAGFKPRGINVGNAGSSDIRLVIDNTAVEFSTAAADTVQIVAGAEDSFIELKGADAKLTLTKGTLMVGTEDGAEQTSGLFFRLPAEPYASAPVVKKAGAGSGNMKFYGNAVIKLDVTDVQGRGIYPIVEDARDSFSVGITAAGGDVGTYLGMLQSNLKVVCVRNGVEQEIDKSLVTLSIENGVLYATVKSRKGFTMILR